MRKNIKVLLAANQKDLFLAEKNGLSPALIDRLMLNKARILKMARSIDQVVGLKDPVGRMINLSKKPNGLIIGKIRVPLGVIAIIYESRPDVTSECSALCLKSGNSIIMRGGQEAIHSNTALWKVLAKACRLNGLHE